MRVIMARLYFEDEAPQIGCGWRVVNVTVGRKWVRVSVPANGARARFARSQFTKIFGWTL